VLSDEQNIQQSDAGDRADLLDDPLGRLDRPDFKNGDGKMNLIDNWKTVAKKAWSVRLTLLAALAAIIGAVLPYLDQGGEAFVALSAILAVCSALSRLVAQPALHEKDEP
jgi:DNA-binding Xre family transcriptional regulator